MAYTDRTYYFPNIMRKVTIAVMSKFANIRVAKYDVPGGTLLNYRNVPLTFGHKQKFIADINKNPDKDYSLQLPRLALVITGLTPDPDKVLGGIDVGKLWQADNTVPNQYQNIFSPVPYMMNFTVSILSMHMTEMNQILEQILPMFNPYSTITVKEFDIIDMTRDYKILLQGTNPIFNEAISEDSVKEITWDINLTVPVYFYRPLRISTLVKTIKAELLDINALTPSVSGDLESTFTYAVTGNEDSYDIITNEWVDN